ncbi:MAG: DegT/DnrJ/EryC1/StrS family aminotransferase, partial [bacterium]
MKVPLLDLKGQYQSIRKEIESGLKEIFDSQIFILGSRVKMLEKAIADYSRARFAVGVSSGSDALLISLMAAGVSAGDEVITSPYTFFATAGSISRLGAIPVFADINPKTFNIDPEKIYKKISAKTRAIIPVHLFGQMADMDPIMEIAGNNGLIVIEDAAQAIGSTYRGKKAGSIGDFGCFSFFPSKNLGCFGDGGIVTTQSEELFEKLIVLRNHGSKPKYFYKFVGGNFRLDEIQAAVLLVKLNYLDTWHQMRRKNAEFYNMTFNAGKSIITPF